MKKAILITGTPGTGKSTIAQMFQKEGFTVIDVGKYAKEHSLFDYYDEERDTYVVDDDLITEAMIELVEKNDSSLPLILDGHVVELPPLFLTHCIVLRCSIRLLRQRLVERDYMSSKVDENVQAEIMEVILSDMLELYGPENVSVVYTDSAVDESFSDVLSKVKKYLDDI
ncbi:MAG: dephospho-CoA kinase [Candidatus Heimdallarchaeota archaeon]|nr:dephospho-CoA kinase [Candidatus Heimdallarchaeota archaeon]MCK4770156.1 dephospho-CoA kinase [Candidatus Heimdallarchaeota archaeon]